VSLSRLIAGIVLMAFVAFLAIVGSSEHRPTGYVIEGNR
jgi:hypothetical protein